MGRAIQPSLEIFAVSAGPRGRLGQINGIELMESIASKRLTGAMLACQYLSRLALRLPDDLAVVHGVARLGQLPNKRLDPLGIGDRGGPFLAGIRLDDQGRGEGAETGGLATVGWADEQDARQETAPVGVEALMQRIGGHTRSSRGGNVTYCPCPSPPPQHARSE